MNMNKFLLSVVAGFVGNVVAYVVLEELIFKGYMERTIYQPTGASTEVALYMPLIAVLLMVIIMAYLYPKGYEGGPPVVEGLRFGILLGLFAGIPFGIFFDLMFPIGFGPALVLILVFTLEIATAGLLIGLVYGGTKPSE